MGFVEVKAPEQFKFEKPGDHVTGILLSLAPHTVKGKQAVQYTILRDNQTKVTFLATWDLAQKIDRTMIGCPVSVKFASFHPTIGQGENKAKVFTVMVDRDAKRQLESPTPEITDEDIPF